MLLTKPIAAISSQPTLIIIILYLFFFRYKKYVMLDPRGVVTKMREGGTDEAFGPADAPTTIALGEEAITQKQETYIYRPDLGEVPMISVPDTLPDLLGKELWNTSRTGLKQVLRLFKSF